MVVALPAIKLQIWRMITIGLKKNSPAGFKVPAGEF